MEMPEPQPPSERAIVMAFIACLVSSAFFYSVARPVVEPLEIGWYKFLIYAIVPTSVTFIILYRSCWHSEITGIARTCSLLLLTCAILGAVLLTVESMLCI